MHKEKGPRFKANVCLNLFCLSDLMSLWDLTSLPLHDRVFRVRSVAPAHTNTASRESFFVHRPANYKYWNEEHMSLAVMAVLEKQMSIRAAALHFNVPKSTLGDRMSGQVVLGAVSGPIKYLSKQEEDEPARFLIRCSAIGYPKTRIEAIGLVHNIVAHKGMDVQVTGGWWESFCKRHPKLTLRAPAPLSTARAQSTDPEVVNRFFFTC